MAWWEDEDQNPDIHYLDYSKRKILFEDPYYGFQRRRRSDSSIRWELSSIRHKYKTYSRSLTLSKRGIKIEGSGSMDTERTVKILPSQLLRKWRKAGRILNVAHALGKIQAKAR